MNEAASLSVAALPSVAFIGAGRLGCTLARALAGKGVAVRAVASRSVAAAQALAAQLPACAASTVEDAAASAELVFLTVPDDAIAPTAAALRWRQGQRVVHCSGATEIEALAPAAAQGAQIGGFHPLQIFSDPERALALLAGSTVAIEAGPALSDELHALAALLGLQPLTLQAGTRAAYHGAASFAASFLLSMLDEAAQVWQAIGLPREQALRSLLPLARGTLDAAEAKGLAQALAGPISRGDAGVVARHLQAFDALGGAHGGFYRELSRRQMELARASGRLDEPALQRLATLLAAEPAGPGKA